MTESEMLDNAAMAQTMFGGFICADTIHDSKGEIFIRLESSDGERYVITIRPKSKNNPPIAYAFIKLTSDTLDIRDMFVSSKHRNCGLGNVLLSRTMDLAQEKRKKRIWGGIVQKDIDATPFLLDWYQRNGFTVAEPENRALRPMNLIHSVWRNVE